VAFYDILLADTAPPSAGHRITEADKMGLRLMRGTLIAIAIALLCAGTVRADNASARAHGSQPGSVSCVFVRGYCEIRIQDPLARRIPRTQVLPSGPGRGLVTPEVYAEAFAGRPVTITKMSFSPDGQGMRATIDWQ
jgi:hypothetical protein